MLVLCFISSMNFNDELCNFEYNYQFDTKRHVVVNGSHKLEVLTTILLESEKNNSNCREYVVDQCLNFYLSDSLVSKISLPVQKRKLSCGKDYFLELVCYPLYEIGFLSGSRESLFVVKGGGCCNACPEFFGFYDFSGHERWSKLSSKCEVFFENGLINEVFIESGCDSLDWQNGNYFHLFLN